MKHTLKRATSITLSILTATTFAWAKAPSLTATLEPSEIALGEAAQLTVAVQGRNADEPQIPAVNGLEIQRIGQSSQIQIINGAMSANVNYSYAVTPTRAGSFTIPAIRIGRGADAAASQPIILKVGGSGSPAINRPGQNSLPAPAVHGEEAAISATEQQSFGFLRLVAPKQEFYVGEMVPVELKAYFRAGVELRVDGLPKLNSDAFTMNKLSDQPGSSQQVINGVRYTVFTWPTVITAVKAGEYAMSVELPTTVTVRQQAQRPRSRHPFGDDFFDDVFSNFFGAATQKQISLNSEESGVKILSLPAENRPASFTGAVGKFDFAAEATPTRTTAGDPVTLKLKISGVGSFDRVTAPAVERSDAWKSYKPSARFEPGDSAGYSGTKNFEQALVPTQAGALEIPALAFSYFDPEQKQYVTRTSSPVNIEVAPGQTPPAPPLQTASPSTPSANPAASAHAPDKRTPGHRTVTLRPWFLHPLLAVGALLPLVLALCAYALRCRGRFRGRDPKQVRIADAQRALRLQLETMERAAAHGDAGNFFSAACAAFQNLLGLRWSLPPRNITLAEINTRLNGEADGLRTIFGLADEAVYTGRAFAPDELRRLQTLVNNELKKLGAL